MQKNIKEKGCIYIFTRVEQMIETPCKFYEIFKTSIKVTKLPKHWYIFKLKVIFLNY